MTDLDLSDLPDPEDRAMPWFAGEPAFMAWWRHGEELGEGPEGALSFVLEHRR